MNMFKEQGMKDVIYQGTVYDVENYLDMHPGGSEILKDELGKNIDKPFEEAEHTKSARNIFKDLPVVGHMKGSETQSDSASTTSSNGKPSAKREDGQELESKFQFDYTKGLFVQLWHTEWTFEEYY